MDNKGVLISLNRYLRLGWRKPCGQVLQRAQVAIWIILILAVTLLFVAVLLNIGKLSREKTHTARAADSAVLSLGSQLGSKTYELSVEACNGGIVGEWERSYSLVFKVLAVVAAVALSIVTGQLGLVTAAIAILGTGLTLYTEFVLDPKQMDALNRQLARIDENLRYSQSAMQAAFINTITDPNKVIDIYDYDRDGDTTDEIAQFTAWQYERLEKMIEENEGLEAARREAKQKLAALFENEFIPQSAEFSDYLMGLKSGQTVPLLIQRLIESEVEPPPPGFKYLLAQLTDSPDLDFSQELAFFEEPPFFVTYDYDPDDPEETGKPVKRVDYLINDIADITTEEVDLEGVFISVPDRDGNGIITTDELFIYLLLHPSSGHWGRNMLPSLLQNIEEDWSLWIEDLGLWKDKLNEIRLRIDERIQEIGDNPDLEAEKTRLEELVALLDEALSKISEFIDGTLQPFVDALQDTIHILRAGGENYALAQSATYGWEDSLGVHYVRVEVSDYKIPYLYLRTKRRWYGKKRRYELRDYEGTATLTITRFSQDSPLAFAAGTPLWRFRYTKDTPPDSLDLKASSRSVLDNYSYLVSANVHWGQWTGTRYRWKLPFLTSASKVIDAEREDFDWDWKVY